MHFGGPSTLIVGPGSPYGTVSGEVGTSEMLLHVGVPSIHHGPRSKVEFAVFVGFQQLTEVVLTETMACFVQNHCFHVDGPVSVNAPRKVIVVIDLTESNVLLSIVVDVGGFAAINPDVGKRRSKDICATGRRTRVWVYYVKEISL